MNGLFRRILLVCMTIGMVVGFAACDKENDEPDKPVVEQPGENDEKPADYKFYSFVRTLTMSFKEHKNVVLAEVRSNIADLTLSSVTAPEGYDVELKCDAEKDSHDFYVYRVYADMSVIKKESPSNPTSIEGQYEDIKIKLSLSGTGYENGKEKLAEFKLDVPIMRYFVIDEEDPIVYGDVYLKEYRVVPFQDLMNWNEELGDYDLKDDIVKNYKSSNTPLRGFNIYDWPHEQSGGWAWDSWKFNCKEKLFGWGNEGDIVRCRPRAWGGSLNLNGNFSDIYVLSFVLREIQGTFGNKHVGIIVCSVDENDMAGNLVAQHIYTLCFE